MLPFLISALVACSGTSSVVGPDAPDEEGIISVQVEPSNVEVAVGDTARLRVTGKNGKGKAVSLGKREVRWTSSDTTVASVDSTGLVRTLGDGVARINVELATPGHAGPPPRDSARVRSVAADSSGGGKDGSGGDSGGDGSDGGSGGSGDDGASGDSDGSASADTVIVSPGSIQLDVSQSTTLDASVEDTDGQVLDRQVSWSSENPDVATVDSAGNVTARASGTTRILASADSVSGAADVEVVSSTSTSPDAYDDFRAFPEAEGYGAEALTSCDRSSVQVLRVTTLNDTGSGSLRDALDRVKNGILSVVVFDVAGYIDLSRLDFSNNCVYIAGQTAPGDGITIRPPGTGLLLRDGVHDVVIRYLRMRGGYNGDSRSHNNLIVGSGHDIILDHLSFGWTTNYLLGILKYDVSWSRPISGVSVQRSLFHEVLAAHPTAVQITGQGEDNWTKISDISLHHNLFAHNHHRNPANNTYGLKLINNVIYNWMQGATQNGQEARLDAIANYYKLGPMADDRFDWEITWRCDNADYAPSFYLSGNIGPHNDDPNADNWTGDSRMIACYHKTGDEIGQEIPGWENFRRSDPLPAANVPVTIQTATEAYRSVLADVGANARLQCDGRWELNSDIVDRRVIEEAQNGTGVSQPPETENDVGGFPPISSDSPCKDSDRDGMPDEFEDRFGFDPSDPADASHDADADGYTNLEEFLNGSVPK